MIQAPQSYGMPQPTQQVKRPAFSPSYNAVQINLDTPTLNAPPAMPYYPPVNMEPYQQPTTTEAPKGQEPAATVPPQYQPPTATTAPVPQTPAQVPPPVLDTTTAPAGPAEQPQVEIKPADDKAAQTLADEAFKGLSSADYDTQALAMEDIAKKGLNNQEDVIPYVQENILDRLIDIMNADSTNLAGPTERQVELRNKISENDKAIEEAVKAGQDPASVKLPNAVTPEEEAEANQLSPAEQVERNKEYAMFTTAILQKTYADVLQKETGTVPPLTELPGSKAVITTLKTSENPEMAISAIDALRYVQRPEYTADLTTLYTIAQNDARPEVSEAATAALASLNENPTATAAA